MPILFRWIFFACISRAAATLAALLAIYVIIESFDKARYLGHGLTASLMVEYILLKMPFMVSEFMPIIILLGISIYLTDLSKHQEVVAIRAAGLGINKLLTPLLLVATIAATLSFSIGEWVTPITNQRLDLIENVHIHHRTMQRQGVEWLKDEHRFFRLTPLGHDQFKLTIIETNAHGGWLRRIDSARAHYTAQGNHGVWQLQQVDISQPSASEGMVLHHRAQMQLPAAVGPATSSPPKPGYMNVFQLYHYIDTLKHAGLNSSAYIYALHRKFSAPFACFLMVILAAALCLQQSSRSSRASWGLVITIAAGLIFYVVGNAGSLLAASQHLPAAFAAWLPSLVFGGMALFLLLRQEEH